MFKHQKQYCKGRKDVLKSKKLMKVFKRVDVVKLNLRKLQSTKVIYQKRKLFETTIFKSEIPEVSILFLSGYLQ